MSEKERVRNQRRRLGIVHHYEELTKNVAKTASDFGISRVRLHDSNHPLFKMIIHGWERYALIVEVVYNHADDRSNFLRGVRINESKVQRGQNKAVQQRWLNAPIFTFSWTTVIPVLAAIQKKLHPGPTLYDVEEGKSSKDPEIGQGS